MDRLASLAREFADSVVRNSSPSVKVAGLAVALANRLANRNCPFPKWSKTFPSNGTSETSSSTCGSRRTNCREDGSATWARGDAKVRVLGGDRQRRRRRLEG